jgi:hypothetical protein
MAARLRRLTATRIPSRSTQFIATQLADPVDPHDYVPTYALEAARVEPCFERSQRFAEQMALRANVQANIVIIGANTIDLRLRRCDT